MTNPYPARIYELHAWLESRYAVRDIQAVDILLAAQLDSRVAGHARPWIILETDYPAREFQDAWFAFGGAVEAHSLARARVMRTRNGDALIGSWLETRSKGAAGLFVESEWRGLETDIRGRGARVERQYKTLEAVAVRLRVNHPRSALALKPQAVKDMERSELQRLARRALDSDLRSTPTAYAAGPSSPTGSTAGANGHAQAPESFLYWCELLQKVSPWLNDWEALTGNLASVARGISVLYNDQRPPAWDAVERLIRDCVNHTTGEIVRLAAEDKGIRKSDLYTSMARWDDRPVYKEVRRLQKEKILARRLRRGRVVWYTHGAECWRGLIDRDKRILA